MNASATPPVQVFPGQSLQAALDQAQDGDEVQLMAGVHRGQVAVLRQRRLRLKGVGGRPVLLAEGRHAQGKGILVVVDGDIEIDNIEFRGARVPDRNGAGIRFERGRLQVRDCLFADNQTGILAGNHGQAELRVLNSVFRDAPAVEGSLPHLLYAGRIASLYVQDSRFEGGRRGHLLKSRARLNHIIDSHLVDGPGGTASYELEFPEGGTAVVVGSTLGQNDETGNPSIVDFGAEVRPGRDDGRDHRLVMVRNTLVNQRPGDGWFVRVRQERLPQPAALSFVGNTYLGTGRGPAGFDAPALGNRRGALPR